jgi:hypothetical protein
MTRNDAIAAAQREADLTGQPQIVFGPVEGQFDHISSTHPKVAAIRMPNDFPVYPSTEIKCKSLDTDAQCALY